jgi:WS/DGAT/MGAT family acyltransferase
MTEQMRFEHRMSDADALMWTIEKDPMLRSTITSVALLDEAPARGRLRRLIDRGTRLVPRMRQRVRSNPASIAPPRWEVDPHFDLNFHVRFVRAAGDRSLRSVLELAEPMAMQGFDRARPLWEVVVVEDLADGGAAMILKLHHAITDGVGAVKIAMAMFELERDPVTVAEMPPAPTAEVMSQLTRVVDALGHETRRNLGVARRAVASTATGLGGAVRDPAGRARETAATLASIGRLLAPVTSPLSPLMTGRSLSVRFDTLTVPLPEAKAAARAAGATLNDAFVAATAEGFRLYHERMGQPAEQLRMTMPINIRNDLTADLAGNQFVPARFAIPLAPGDPADRMQTMHALVATQREEPANAFVEPVARVLNRLPTSVATGVFGSMLKGIDLVTSNVPGAPVAIFMAGSRLDALFAFGPMTGAAANLTLLSYLDELLIGVNLDPAAVTDPALLVASCGDAWDELLKAG